MGAWLGAGFGEDVSLALEANSIYCPLACDWPHSWASRRRRSDAPASNAQGLIRQPQGLDIPRAVWMSGPDSSATEPKAVQTHERACGHVQSA